MVIEIWVNIGSGNALLPDGTKPLPEPMLIYINGVLWHSPENNFSKVLITCISNMCLEITHLKLLPQIPGTNELNVVQEPGHQQPQYWPHREEALWGLLWLGWYIVHCTLPEN